MIAPLAALVHWMLANLTTIVIPPLLALLVSALVIGVLLRSRAATLVLDHPNQRSLHATPTPRIGGLGIIAGVAAGYAVSDVAVDIRLLVAVGLLIVISLLDDLRNLGVIWRMLAHLVCAGLAATVFVYAAHGLWAALAVALAVAWMTNLYNFMDGSDGLAGGMAVCGFGSYGVAALAAGDIPFAGFNFSIAAAAIGFLFFNFPPARVFMGDAGSIPLGFLAAVCALAGWQRQDWPLWFGAAIFSPFVVDASLTLGRRLLRGAKVWRAHREHYYQRLVQAGWGHRKTLFAEFALMLFVCVITLTGIRTEKAAHGLIIAGIAALYLVLIAVLERKLRPTVQNA